MKVINVRNVAEALPAGLAYLAAEGRWEATRAGLALVAPGPVATVYVRPRERVLFSPLRDANPVFHLLEACWILAGRRDAAFLNNFVKDFGERFAEPDDNERLPNEPGAPGTIHDAYGYRWRHGMGFDQLDAVVFQLSTTPGSRQAVLQMWDCTDPDGLGWDDLRGVHRTRPCNTHIYLRVHDEERAVYTHDSYHGGALRSGTEVGPGGVLDITVCCRSNDVVWGAYGSNAVHFSVLQEYLAARLDLGVGTYVQFSNNYHCYKDQWEKLVSAGPVVRPGVYDDRYSTPGLTPLPLVHDAESFDLENRILLEKLDADLEHLAEREPRVMAMHNLFLSQTVWPMVYAHKMWRGGLREEALAHVESTVSAADWRAAAAEWMQRRMK